MVGALLASSLTTCAALLLVSSGPSGAHVTTSGPSPSASFGGVDGSATPTNFNLVTAEGDVWTFGSAHFFGSLGTTPLAAPVESVTSTTGGRGYWLVASDGGVFAFGNAVYFGSTGGIHLAQPIVGLAPTPDAQGYWLVASDGGVFAFGDAGYFGSTGGIALTGSVTSLTPTRTGAGYWLLGSDGGVFAFGDAPYLGSSPTPAGAGEPAERIVPDSGGKGYWIFRQNGDAPAFGDAHGTPPAQDLYFAPRTPGDQATLFAFAQVGKPYIYGGNGPEGYDCSGLALASWVHTVGIGFARGAIDQYLTAGTSVGLTDLQAGDLVFWGSDPADGTTVYHTAIYVGGDRIVESTGDHVQLNSLAQWGSHDLMRNGRRP